MNIKQDLGKALQKKLEDLTKADGDTQFNHTVPFPHMFSFPV